MIFQFTGGRAFFHMTWYFNEEPKRLFLTQNKDQRPIFWKVSVT